MGKRDAGCFGRFLPDIASFFFFFFYPSKSGRFQLCSPQEVKCRRHFRFLASSQDNVTFFSGGYLTVNLFYGKVDSLCLYGNLLLFYLSITTEKFLTFQKRFFSVKDFDVSKMLALFFHKRKDQDFNPATELVLT